MSTRYPVILQFTYNTTPQSPLPNMSTTPDLPIDVVDMTVMAKKRACIVCLINMADVTPNCACKTEICMECARRCRNCPTCRKENVQYTPREIYHTYNVCPQCNEHVNGKNALRAHKKVCTKIYPIIIL